MKVFISWSGERSHQVAKLLNKWIQCVIQAVDPWISSKNIDKGSLWFSEINEQLADTHHGIICLTKSNINKPWILFEAGAIVKGLPSSRAFTFLIDLEPRDISDPLARFNHTKPNKQDVYELLLSINRALGNRALTVDILEASFEAHWKDFENKFKKILKSTPKEDIKIEREDQDMLSEILYSVRGMNKRIQELEEGRTDPLQNKYSNPVHAEARSNFNKLQQAAIRLDAIQIAKDLFDKGLGEKDIYMALSEKYPHISHEYVYRIIKNLIRN